MARISDPNLYWDTFSQVSSTSFIPGALVLLALGLRLLVWRWHRLYDLGGDEREYFEQALTLLRDIAMSSST